MDHSALAAARTALHGVAELVLAGPQYRASKTIRLRVVPGGFATVAAPDLRVDSGFLVAGQTRIPLSATTYEQVGTAVGVEAGAPEDLYHDGSGVLPGHPLDLDPAAAGQLAECFATGDRALRDLAPDASPVLWPEHFDVGITIDEVNYGVSLGDSTVPEPYAYVGPWRARTGEFWNVPFGAAQPLRDLSGAGAVLGFFTEGRRQAANT
jgi:hypothetical protein